MPNWWQGAFAAVKKSHDDSVIPSGNGKPGFFSSRRHRILTRAKKLLQPLDAIDVGSPDKFRNPSPRPVAAPSPAPASSPLPLPLPELHMALQRDPKQASGSLPLPSPVDDKLRETAEAANREAAQGHDAHSKSQLVGQGSRRYTRENQCSKSPQRQHTKTTSLESYPKIPSSAPCSPFSSTELSPARNEMWGAYYPTTPPVGIFQVWSAPESGSHHKHAFSLDTSPLPSPGVTPVHPLPLPPSVSLPAFPTPISPVGSVADLSGLSGASLPLQSPPVALHMPKGDFSASQGGADLAPVKSKWQKGKLIGRGTFGSVYVASNRETGALCAMKEVEMLPDDSKSAECIRQLEQEIKVLSSLKHPNIVQYYGSEIIGDKFYIYLEYVHPGSINKFIHDHYGAITESVVRNFTRHILFGLAYLHGKKTIHRDIKGANLLVDAYGVVKLADFGMAKLLNGQTANLSLKGSPYWMAPELLQSTMQTDASWDMALAVDIWSLGCTIIEMMNGKPPWSEYEGAAALFKVLKETPPVPETMSTEGKDFLQCCFRRNPADRPTATRLLDHPFVNYSNLPDACTQSNKEIKDNMQYLRERVTYKPDQLPVPVESAQTNKGRLLSNNLSFAVYESFTPIPNAAISKNPI